MVETKTVREHFEELGFRFEDAAPIKGQPRLIGKIADNLAHLEIVGDPAQPAFVTFMGGVPNNAPVIAQRTGLLASILLSAMLPQWSERGVWFRRTLQALVLKKHKAQSHQQRVGEATVIMEWQPKLGTLLLTVRHKLS